MTLKRPLLNNVDPTQESKSRGPEEDFLVVDADNLSGRTSPTDMKSPIPFLPQWIGDDFIQDVPDSRSITEIREAPSAAVPENLEAPSTYASEIREVSILESASSKQYDERVLFTVVDL